MNYKKGDTVIYLGDDKLYTIKYIIGDSLIVVYTDKGYDMPLNIKYIVPYSPLMEELI
jgi:hypothetical protein